MRRVLLAAGCLLGAASALAEPGCIDEGYDAMAGGWKRGIAVPAPGVVTTVDPERSEPLSLEDPTRPPLSAAP
jgi:hypothetical protein